MKRVLILLAAAWLAGILNAQTLMDEDFNSGIPSTWTMYNDDNTPRRPQLFPAAWVDSRMLLGGYGYAVSTSYFSPAATADRWLVTPRIAVPDSHYYLTFRASSYSSHYPEKLVIRASNASVQQDNFTITLQAIEQLPADWTTYSIPLDEFEGTSCYLAFQLNTYDGYLCLLDRVTVLRPAANEIRLTAINAPTYTTLRNRLTIGGSVQNMGYRNLTSFDARYVVDSDTSEVYHVSDINVPYGESVSFTHNVPYAARLAGSHTVRLLVSRPNGADDADTDNVSAPFYAIFTPSAGTATRNVLLELFTGSKSGYAPGAERRIAEATAGRDDIIWITHHAGYNQDALSNAASDSLTWYFGGNAHVPAMMTDRYNFSPASHSSPINDVGTPEALQNTLYYARHRPCFLSLRLSDMAYDPASRHVSGTVSGTFGSPVYSDATRLTLYLVEDSLMTSQAGDSNTFIEDYVNNNTVRTAVTAPLGDNINISSNGQFQYNYHFTLPQDINPYNTRLVAIIGNRNPYNCNNSPVFNAAQTANIAKNTGLTEATDISINIYPNPAITEIYVSSDNTLNCVILKNALGQTIYRHSHPDANPLRINTHNLPSGLYLLTIHTPQGTASRRICIAK